MSEEKNKGGRPTGYSKEVAEEILSRIMCGEPLMRICRDEHLPEARTVYRWLANNEEWAEEFRHLYAQAREIQADTIADETFDIVDDGSNDVTKGEDGIEYANHENIARSRLRFDQRKWFLSKVAPKKYGDKLDVTTQGDKIESVVQYHLPDNGRG